MLREARKQIPGIKREEVREFLETQYAYTRHKPARRKFPKRAVIAVNINNVYQMDLVDLQKFAEFSDGVRYLLTAIDCFTRYAFAVPVKSKKPTEIIQGLLQIFKEYAIPLKIFTDKGTEFRNKHAKALPKELDVLRWYSNNPGKAVMVERFNRTLKERLWVHMSDQNGYRYIDVLADVVSSYNNSEHSSTGLAPKNITGEHAAGILRSVDIGIPESKPKFKIGDRVRVSTSKMTF